MNNNIFGAHEDKTLAQLADVASRATRVALMADGHLGYVMPIGGVAAYDQKVSVVGVGFDIACGNCAILTDLTLEQVCGLSSEDQKRNPSRVIGNARLNEFATLLQSELSFGIGRKNDADDAPVDDPLFMDDAWYVIPNIGRYRDDLRDKARRQLGTIGSGNHYVDVFVDTKERIWIGVHFGSRGLGHTIATNFLALGQGMQWGDKGKEQEVLLDLTTQLGQEYWALMNLAGRYAYAGREWVAKKVVEWLGGVPQEIVHNHHNFAWKEQHQVEEVGLQELVVVRKGATPAFPGQMGFVGGSMGDDSVILRGSSASKANDSAAGRQQAVLYSTVHGAGRVMSRTEAAGKRHRRSGQLMKYKEGPRAGQVINAGRVSPQMMQQWLAKSGVILRGGGCDESPHCYRRLTDVLEAQGNTIDVLEVLSPVIVVMAGENEFDPFKD
jgi:tRNA-splicing ligase RtcB (3'-phosphate/5'-hydroxy nucleic acid ligase)